MWPPMTGRVSRTISTLAGESSRGWARIVSSEVSDVVMGTLLRIHSPTAVEGVDSERGRRRVRNAHLVAVRSNTQVGWIFDRQPSLLVVGENAGSRVSSTCWVGERTMSVTVRGSSV